MEWRTIETAPRDGTEVVGAEWQRFGNSDYELFVHATCYTDGGWRYPSGVEWSPSHWMPPPPHPQGEPD